jgi:hypothetical protein
MSIRKFPKYYATQLTRIQSEGIEEVRKRIVPAYTLTKFGVLPRELQARIWSMAARFNEPKTQVFVSMQSLGGKGKGSSLIDYKGSSWRPELFPKVLHVCRHSREEALKVYTQLRTTKNLKLIFSPPRVAPYVNTLYDNFYLGGDKWDDFKILIDLLIKGNTTRPLLPEVQKDLEGLQNIRCIIVDFNIFAAAPVKIWAEFPKLERLWIAFYPFNVIKDRELENEEGIVPRNPKFVKPQRGSWAGKRADWIINATTKAFETAKQELPHWRVPKIEAVVRKTGEDIDYEIEALEEYQDDEITEEYDFSEDERERDEAESNWRQQAAARMTHSVSRERIKHLKRKYRPSQRYSLVTAWSIGKKLNQYITDSEQEEGVSTVEYSEDEVL